MFQQENKSDTRTNPISIASVIESEGGHAVRTLPDTKPQTDPTHTLQAMADNSAQVKQLRSYQLMANGGAVYPIQKKAATIPVKNKNASPAPVVQLLRDEYAFTNAGFQRDLTNEMRGVYLFTADGEQVVVKYDTPVTEIGLTKLARQAGLGAADIRPLTPTELGLLTGIPRVRMRADRGAVMEFVPGEKLELSGSDDEGVKRDMSVIFTPAVLMQIGRSYAFQLLTESADRWPMPVPKGEGTMTQGNSGNILLSNGMGGPRVKDIDFTPTPLTADYAESLRASFRSMVRNANGGTLVKNVVDMIGQRHNADYTIPDEDRVHIVAGMTDIMGIVDTLDVADAGLGMNYQAKMRAVRDVYAEELETERQRAEAAARAKAEAEAKKCKCCFITTACTEAKGLPDDCEELTVLRKFRDGYLFNKPNGQQLFELYYEYSPRIVTAIRRREDEEKILQRLYNIIIQCVKAIKQDNPEFAYRTYCSMTLELIEEFIPDSGIDVSVLDI